MAYKIFNVKDLLSEIQYEGVRKGTKTELYLEDVIKSIDRTKKYRWIQFFQLVDVFYVVVETLPSQTRNTMEEIQDHYSYKEPVSSKKTEPVVVEHEREEMPKSAPSKITFPWKSNK